ncbi:MAG: class I SAM-dependent methyltransferase [Pseudomonadales bacterium]|nr:class I SAM-dependent methyltransferase [Pseudomonadales bacterium]
MNKKLSAIALGLALGWSALASASDLIVTAVANESRPAADRALDAGRKPAEVLSFFEIEPGMSVLDVFGGGGYYTEILSSAVGEDGFVTLYNNKGWENFVGKQVDERLAGDRLANVDRLMAAPEAIMDMSDQYDAAIFVLGMHDIYVSDPENDWPQIDRDRFLKGLYQVLAPGAVLGVVDHNAESGSDPAVVGKTLHRIDPAIIIRDLQAAGFVLEARSDALRNPADSLDKSVFDEQLRWKTDRSVLRFRKPE